MAEWLNAADLKKTLDQGVDVIVPMIRHSDFRDHFTYDKKKNIYKCPEHHLLVPRGIHANAQSFVYQIPDPLICQKCPRFGVCTKSKHGRRVDRPFTEETREKLEWRYKQPAAKKIFRRRKIRVEHPFGHIKHNMGMRSFLLRGIVGAKAEAALVTTSFNLTRMVTLLGVNDLVQRLNTLPT